MKHPKWSPLLFVLGALTTAVPRVAGQALPHPDHIVVVIEENKDYAQIIGSPNASYLNSLLPRGALLKRSYALHHPSQPNYLELFSGAAHGVCNDRCPFPQISAPNLGASLAAASPPKTFIGYAENLPSPATACATPKIYGRKHCPWMDFTNVPASATKDFSAFPTTAAGFANLPAVSFVIPDLIHDMHNLPNGAHDAAQEIRNGDAWLRQHLDTYAQWAVTHNSLLIITWDEDNAQFTSPGNDCAHPVHTTPPANHIATIIVGAHVIPGSTSSATVTHYNVLRTIEDMEGVAQIGGSAGVGAIMGIWQ
jgi:acid phosphatase